MDVVDALCHFRALGASDRSATLRSPNATLFFRRLAKVGDWSGAARAWERATLLLDGHPSDGASACLRALDAAVESARLARAAAGDALAHDAANLALKLLRFARWCLLHPDQESTVVFGFPRARRRLDLLLAARAFLARTESAEERALLKAELRSELLAPVAGAPARASAYLFQSPTEWLLLDALGSRRWDKQTTSRAEVLRQAFGG